MSSFRQRAKRALQRSLERVAPHDVRAALRYVRATQSPAFPKKNIVVERDLGTDPVLLLAPHPDDEAIGAGGALLAHRAAGAAVHVAYMTDGGGIGIGRGELSEIRRGEARAAGERLGATQTFWDHADTELTNDPPTVAAMEKLLDEVSPKRIYVPSFFDTHFDHFATGQILVDAVRQSGWSGTICGYEVWDAVPFPNYLVDVSPHAVARDEVLACYHTPHETTDFTKLVRYRTSVHYTLFVNSHKDRADLGFAEAFLRFDAGTYCAMQQEYVVALKQARSPLVAPERLRL